jgi:hypothetical protein
MKKVIHVVALFAMLASAGAQAQGWTGGLWKDPEPATPSVEKLPADMTVQGDDFGKSAQRDVFIASKAGAR